MESESKRAILAVILSGIVLFGWQYFFPSQPVVTPATTAPNNTANPVNTTNQNTNTENTNNKIINSNNVEAPVLATENFILSRDNLSYEFTNNLRLVKANSINSDKTYPEIYDEITTDFTFTLNGSPYTPFFKINKISDEEYVLNDPKGVINGTVNLDELGVVNFSFNSSQEFGYKFITKSGEDTEGSFAMSNLQPKQYIFYSKELDTVGIGDSLDPLSEPLTWFGPDFHYHFLASIFLDKEIRNTKAEENGTFTVSSIKNVKELNFKQVFAQKNYDDLIGLGHKLELSVDFGILSIIAVPILRGLQFFFTVIPNYGVSIILLTILIRMLTFPLQYKSFKSMKKMQVIQPELTKIREKHKENPQQMQKETMALFKKAGANPLSGCLPLLLQMPIFFAFYKVLYSSVELVEANFIFWIVDLSVKDPYYVLPVLMSVAMFLNMKLTPQTSADPAQQKIMMFMPVIFGFMMMSLPAGLTLYIFVSTVVGMLQQLFVYKRVS